ncbi:DNA/RNA endonuclease G [Beggiatoa sp. PS]|nr:DNA/RNA endonuclease G [Beggiatoa sp. PS]
MPFQPIYGLIAIKPILGYILSEITESMVNLVKRILTLDRDGYSLGYSYEYKNSLWVSYIMSKGSIGIDVDRSDEFYADPAIPEKYRVQPEDFSNTGYDRGHLAPSAAIDFSRIANQQTFAMSNVAFQDPKLNRQAWGSLEKMVRSWTKTKGKMYVITGPLFDEKPKRINDVPVPSSFYKIIYAIEHDKSIGFIFLTKISKLVSCGTMPCR